VALRPEEAFVRDCLVKFLGESGGVTAREGENPPDLYLSVDGTEHAVEVSQLTPITVRPTGRIGNRVSEDKFGIFLCESLNKRLGPRIPDDHSLLLNVRLPVKDATRFRTALGKLLEELVLPTGPVSGGRDYPLMEVTVGVSWIPQRPSGKKVVGIVQNKHANPDILINATFILCDRLREKEEHCAKLDPSIPRWLGLFNDYWLADAETYVQAYAKCQYAHSFKRVYVVSDTGDVSLLYGET
jgi:hypothetical protein